MATKFLKHALWIAILIICCVPVTFIVTFLMIPFWSWLEATYGIESIGHSGPSEWCFNLMFVLLSAISVSGYILVRRRTALIEPRYTK